MADVTIRLAERRDAEAIRVIYNAEVTSSTVTFDMVPRTIDEQVAWLDEHSGGHPAIVAVNGDGSGDRFRLALALQGRPRTPRRWRTRSTWRPSHRGQGLGKALLHELVRMGRDHGFHSIMARIVGDHEASIELHRACGFEDVGVEREVGRKFGRWLDVGERCLQTRL